jgi:tetratricopeptide (TPR) repeat protein
MSLTTSDPTAPPAPPKLLVLGLSKDRPLQLDAMLRSFRARCRDAAGTSTAVLCRSSTAAHQIAYRELSADFPDVTLIAERDLKRQLEDLLAVAQAVLVVEDATVFVRDFEVQPLVTALAANDQVACAALRLGRNIRAQALPELEPTATPGVATYRWGAADGDFGRPFTPAATLFAAGDLLTLLRPTAYASSGELADALAGARAALAAARPLALCFDASVAVTLAVGRADPALSEDALLERYIRGDRFDVGALDGIVPVACEQELAPPLLPPASAPAPVSPGPPPASTEPYEPVLRQIESLAAAGNLREAHATVTAFLSRNPGHATATVDLATLLAVSGLLDAAQAALEPIVERQPEHAEARRKLGAVLLRKGDANGAIAVVHPLLKADPKHPETLLLFGEGAAALGAHDKALTFLRAAASNGGASEALGRRIAELESVVAGAPAVAAAR